MNPDELEVTCSDLQDLLASAAPPRLVDCREIDEWNYCRIDGAELVPLSSFAVEAPRRFAGETRGIVIYCHHGRRSAQAAHSLRSRGVPNVWSLAGGIDEWSRGVDPGVPRY